MRRTPYDGPEETIELTVGGRVLKLVRPADPDRLLTDPEVLAWNCEDDYMPYWAYFWPGAFLLAEAVAREARTSVLPAPVLEIGCGLGLAGLAALAHGAASVVFSDYDETPLRFVERSVRVNGFAPERFQTRRLDWREPPGERYPLILGADVLYERRLVPLVVNLLAHMLTEDGVALLAGPYRVATEDLPGALEERGLRATTCLLGAMDDAGRIHEGRLHRVSRAGPAG